MCPLKILSVDQIREADAFTIEHEPVSSVNLMERAARACYEWLVPFTKQYKQYKVVCGMGNNGGDGLAIARLLHSSGLNVEVFYIRHALKPSEDNSTNFKRIANIPGLVVTEVYENNPVLDLNQDDVVIDALLGSGLNKPVTGFLKEIIHSINTCNGFIISIDMPSGLFADSHSSPDNAIVSADYTLSFQLPKLAFFIPENDIYIGEWHLLDIGLNKDFIASCKTQYYLTKKQDCSQLLQHRKRYSHKGTFGHALLIAGSIGKVGAAILSAQACVRAGAGLVTAHVPFCAMNALHTTVPEVMLSLDESETHFSSLPGVSSYNAVAIGPGLGMDSQSQSQFKLLIQEFKRPMVIDADALNILSENKTWIPFIPQNSILTPHPKEFERLTSKVDDHFNRMKILQAFTERFKLYVILKGAYTAIGCPDGTIYFNSTGNPGMATGGSGDVLTGILLGLLASGYTPKETCILGTWLHGKAGDIAANIHSQPSMIAGDITKSLGKAFLKIT